MNYTLYISNKAKEQLKKLKHDNAHSKQFKAVKKALRLLQTDPRHPSLQTHIFYSLKGPWGEKVFEAYAEQHTPAAFRIFFSYGKKKGEIFIISIESHPN